MNHDGTTGTVDLISKYVLYNMTTTCYSDETDKWMMYYNTSAVKDSLEYFCNDFTDDVKNAIKTQSVAITAPDGAATYKEYKIKCPSLTELGCKANYAGAANIGYAPNEGSIYPLFGTAQVQPNSLAIFKNNRYNGATEYWTRTPYIRSDYGYNVLSINDKGYFKLSPPNNSYLASRCVVGIIRF